MTRTLPDVAADYGRDMRAAYRSEFGEDPEPRAVGDWDATAFEGDWGRLQRNHGATLADYYPLWAAWGRGFYGLDLAGDEP